MGDMQHFCLRWNNYQSSITSAFENLRDDEDFVDVTLACDGKSLKAHRVVLSACSPYFRELLKSTPCKHPVIVLQDVIFEDLHALVEFIYHGEVNVHQRSLASFLKTAEVLRVSGLTQQTEVRDEVLAGSEKERGRDRGDDRGPSPPHRRTPTISHRHRERRSSTGDNPDAQDPNALPLKRIKTNDNTNNHSSQEGQQSTPINHQDDTEEPPVDFSTTQSSKNNNSSIKKQDNDLPSPVDDNLVKSEPTDLAPISNPPEHFEDSNDSGDMMSETGTNQQLAIDHEDSIHSGHQSYLDSKLFAVAGASFNFSMAAALAADSLAGLNNQGHVSGGVDGLAGTSQGYWKQRTDSGGAVRRGTTSTGTGGGKLVCAICNKSYSTMNSLRNHRSIYHRPSRNNTQKTDNSSVQPVWIQQQQRSSENIKTESSADDYE